MMAWLMKSRACCTASRLESMPSTSQSFSTSVSAMLKPKFPSPMMKNFFMVYPIIICSSG